MNRLRHSTVCLVCTFDMFLPMSTALVRYRAEWARQMANGICDSCSRLRHRAAEEFERASYAVHLMRTLGAGWQPGTRPVRPIPVLARALDRLKAAEQECVRLKMWPANERSTT